MLELKEPEQVKLDLEEGLACVVGFAVAELRADAD